MAKPNFFTCTKHPYYIVSSNFVNKFAGVRALHYLCHMLNQLGCEAYLLGCEKTNPKLHTPLLQPDDVVRHQKLGLSPIVVYPETVPGNPLDADCVVRWLLNKPGHLGADAEFSEKEMQFAFSADFIPEGHEIPILRVPVVDTSVFHNRDNPDDLQRKGTCYYANKYLAKGGKLTSDIAGAISVSQDVSLSQSELAAILRKSELLFCYEPSSIVTEALLCGCPVAIVDTPYVHGVSGDFQGPGISFGTSNDGIEQARATVKMASDNYAGLEQECIEHVQRFINRSQAVFSGAIHYSEVLAGKVAALLKTPSVGLLPLEFEQASQASKWLQQHQLDQTKVTVLAERLSTHWQKQPTFHLLIVVNRHELDALATTLSSLQEQLYSAWGLTIISDIAAPEVFNDVPENIEWIQLGAEINEVIERVVAEAGLDWIMQLLPGDILSPHALLSFGETVNLETNKHFIYSDELVDEENKTIWFKPAFSLDYLRAFSYLGRSFVVSRKAFEGLGGYSHLAYVYATDLAFRVYEKWGEPAFAHIPDVLCTSARLQQDAETLTENEWLTRHAHFKRLGIKATISHPQHKNRFQTQFKVASSPLVSIIIAHHNLVTHLAQCLDELVAKTSYTHFEVIVVDVASDREDLEGLYAEHGVALGERFRVVHVSELSFASALNKGAEIAKGDYLTFLSCFARTINGNWLTELLPLVQREDVSVVGTRIISDDNKIVHAGGIPGCTDDVLGLYEGYDLSESGYMERAHCIQAYRSVSSACMAVSTSDFHQTGGFTTGELADSRHLITDFCLKQQMNDRRVLWTPYATVYLDIQAALSTNGVNEYQPGFTELYSVWREQLSTEPFHNVNLRLQQGQSLPETGIVCRWDTRIHDRCRVMALALNNSGTGQYRLKAPLIALEDAGEIQLTWLPDHEAQEKPRLPSLMELNRLQPDVLYVQQALSDRLYQFLEVVKTKTSIKIIFALDDLVTELPPRSNRRAVVFRDMRYRLRRTLALCDRVIVSTAPLAELCHSYCSDVVVIPNRLETKRWLSLPEHASSNNNKPRIGWAGATQHEGDLAVILGVVKALAERVDWVFMGMCPKEIRQYVKEVHEFVSFEKYPQKLASLSLDLALAPLEAHPFNEAKSNLRLLEYGVMGWPVIASDIYPYQQSQPPITLVENQQQAWQEAIIAAIEQPEKIAAQGRQLQHWVRQNFILEDHLSEWLMAIKAL